MDKFRHTYGAAITLWLVLFTMLLTRQVLAAAQTQSSPPRTVAPLQSLAELDDAIRQRPLQIKGWKTLTGSKVLFIQTSELPMFDLHVSFAAGSAQDQQHPGLAAMTLSLLTEGVEGKDLATILETFDSLGAKLGTGINRDRAQLSLRSLNATDKREPALQLFAQMLGKPLLAEDAMTRVKAELLGILEQQGQTPSAQVSQTLYKTLFAGHAYAQPVYGTTSSLASITREQLQAFHNKAYAAGNVLITLVGDLSLEDAQNISLQIANALPQGPAVEPVAEVARQENQPGLQHIERPLSQTHLMLTQLGITRQHPDYVALQVASMIFGGAGSNSRLMNELREQRGLTYSVAMGNTAWQGRGPFGIYVQTRPEFSTGTLKLIQDMFRDYLATGPTEQELDDAKRILAGSSPLDSASNAQILSRLVDISLNNLPLDLDFSVQQAQQLTIEDIRTALNKHFGADQWTVVTLGPTVEQQALPDPVKPAEQSMCRVTSEFRTSVAG